MKLSGNFVEVLKNFSTINSGIVFKPGNVIRTISQNKTILAQAEVEETFDTEFGIYDLTRLLALLSLNKQSPEIEIEKESLVYIGLGGKGKIRQRFTDIKLISQPPESAIPMKTVDVELELKQEIFDWVFNVSSILKCPHIVIQATKGEKVTINALDVKGEIVDSAYVTLDVVSDKNFKVVVKNENIKVIPGTYNVKISKSGFALFTHSVKKLQYWIAIEGKNSSFEG